MWTESYFGRFVGARGKSRYGQCVLALLWVETDGGNNGISGQTWLQIICAASRVYPRPEWGSVPHLRAIYSQSLKDRFHGPESDDSVGMQKDGKRRIAWRVRQDTD